MKKLVLFLLLVAFSFLLKAQLSVNYYYDGNTVGISTSPAQKHWWEFRVNTTSYIHSPWSYAERGITQAYYCFKLIDEEKAGLYTGLGVGLPLLSLEVGWASINVPVGIQINPFNTLPNLYLTGEYNAMTVVTDDFELVNTLSVGFKYLFKNN
ncbi:MAG: hypothetical protein HN778_01545 [Prolixibacteraceae bacterium]|jgi:hypothetical protein|nr:hypothetical protein [Prolixibacteraceae bacterium]MBT6007301.1 hypothetical protein [Prolixibacteraceae bacterium]MBT6766215.1 hypothetical protein [Prolixibacteraceae bacterium]MBT7000545.1 hypothetical protein [Prolixibacteraceae bacterium]MBT7393493.1 hypothetical protein [Prolixibacteraceae bacterium]